MATGSVAVISSTNDLVSRVFVVSMPIPGVYLNFWLLLSSRIFSSGASSSIASTRLQFMNCFARQRSFSGNRGNMVPQTRYKSQAPSFRVYRTVFIFLGQWAAISLIVAVVFRVHSSATFHSSFTQSIPSKSILPSTQLGRFCDALSTPSRLRIASASNRCIISLLRHLDWWSLALIRLLGQ